MTQEEKARAYDEALKKARFYHGNCPSEPERKKLEKMFPVLHESEDERMLQTIIRGFENWKSNGKETFNFTNVDDILAYLEKQKEQKPAEVKDPFSNANFVRGYESGYADAKREQKPIQTSEEKEYIRTLKSLISDFIRDKQPADVAFYQKIYDWLEGRHIEQKPAEWSEEDEKRIQRICDFLWKNRKGDTDTIYQIEKDADWLKSLRPSWKPSEEQMKALNALNLHGDLSYVGQQNQLISLYQDLKKLM